MLDRHEDDFRERKPSRRASNSVPWCLVVILFICLIRSELRHVSQTAPQAALQDSPHSWQPASALLEENARQRGGVALPEATDNIEPSARQLVLVDKPGDSWCSVWCSVDPSSSSSQALPVPPATTRAPAAPSRTTTQQSAPGQAASHTQSHSASSSDVLTERVIAAMTLGAVAFQMSLFYIINHRDDDIKRYSLSVIGQTISIFCAVLSFQAVFGVVDQYLRTANTVFQTLLCPALSIFFMIAMEGIVMVAARVRGEHSHQKVFVKSGTTKLKLDIPAHVLNAKTFGAGAAQLCAAASIRGFGHLQLLAYSKGHSCFLASLICPIVFWSLFGTSWLLGRIRGWIILWDGIIDECEKTWIEVAEECEDEVIALSCGFHVAVSIRVAVTDSMPMALLEGWDHRSSLEQARAQDVGLLWLVGIGCAVACMAINKVAFGLLSHGINMTKLRSDSVSRIVRVFALSLGMTFAWCTCFGTHLLALNLPHAKEGLQMRLYIALFQSIVCYIVVLLLDFIADMKVAGPAFDKALVMLIGAFGTSVGLTWEQAFHECAHVAVEFMAEDETNPLFAASNDPKVWALFLSGIIVLAVLPAYRFYIVPRMYQMIEEHAKFLHESEEMYRRSTISQSMMRFDENMFEWDRDTQLEMADTAYSRG